MTLSARTILDAESPKNVFKRFANQGGWILDYGFNKLKTGWYKREAQSGTAEIDLWFRPPQLVRGTGITFKCKVTTRGSTHTERTLCWSRWDESVKELLTGVVADLIAATRAPYGTIHMAKVVQRIFNEADNAYRQHLAGLRAGGIIESENSKPCSC